MFTNLDSNVIEVDVLVFRDNEYLTKFTERLHVKGLDERERQESMRKELRNRLSRTSYAYEKGTIMLVVDNRIGTPFMLNRS